MQHVLHLKASSFSSYYIKNNGNSKFEYKALSSQAQIGPTLYFEFLDVNKYGRREVLGIGGFIWLI